MNHTVALQAAKLFSVNKYDSVRVKELVVEKLQKFI